MKLDVTKQVLSEFTTVQEKCLNHLQESSSLATSLGGISSAVVHFETFRTRTPEALSVDSSFIQVRSPIPKNAAKDLCRSLKSPRGWEEN